MIEKLNDLTHDCVLEFNNEIKSFDFLLIADVHFDSVSCDRKLLKKHLDEVVERNAKVLIFGDFFDIMGGKFDKRSSKGDLRPEYNTSNYIDNVVDDAINFLTPYKEYIMFISPGNHELSILRYHETDVIKRLSKALDAEVGTYGGWIRMRYSFKGEGNRGSYKIAYNHGYGGGGPVTKDVIQTNRRAVYLPDANIVISGHTHDRWIVPVTRNRISRYGESVDQQWHIKTGTYQNAPIDFNGYAVEKGLSPKAGAGIWMKYTIDVNKQLLYNFQFAE